MYAFLNTVSQLIINIEIEKCIKEQIRCRNDWRRTNEVGALLGLNDYFCEEAILRKYERDKKV